MSLLDQTRKYFAIPLEEKKHTMCVQSSEPQRGWKGVGVEKTVGLTLVTGEANLSGKDASFADLEDGKVRASVN